MMAEEEALAALPREEQEDGGRAKRPRDAADDDDDEDAAAADAARRPQQRRQQASGPYRPAATDFGALAEAHPPLRPFLRKRGRPGGGGGSLPAAAAGAPLLQLDFADWRATRELTAALLRREYGVRGWRLPAGRLVPPVPNREAYLRWIADLLALVPPPPPPPTGSSPRADAGDAHEIRGLDLGCGASLIYCLLGAAGWGWRMLGVDADASALEAAAENARAAARAAPPIAPLLGLARAAPADLAPVAAALLGGGGASSSSSLSLSARASWADVPGRGDGVLARALRAEAWGWGEGQTSGGGGGSDEQQHEAPPSLRPPRRSFAFCVCNPPFFEHEGEAGRNPRTACGGTPQEMVCPGGEAAFVASMVADSAALALEEQRWREGGGGGGGGRGGGGAGAAADGGPARPPSTVHWYSTMVGKKSTLKAARAALHELMRAPLPDDAERARVTAVRTTTLSPQQGGGEGGSNNSGGGGGKATQKTSPPTTRWCIAWTFAPSAKGSESRPLPSRGEGLAAAGAWLLRQTHD